MLARSVAVREKALLILRSAHRLPVAVSLAPFAIILVVQLCLSGFRLPLWPSLVIEVACALSISLVVFVGHFYRQFLALVDLVLVDRG